MSRISAGGWGRVALLIFLGLTVASMGLAAKTKNPKWGSGSELANLVRPELVNAQTNPTLRFPVMSMPGSVFSITYGWLDISSNTIRYTVVQPPSKSGHDFEVSRFAVNDLRLNSNVLSFKSPKQRQMLVYLSQDRWGISAYGPGHGAGSQPWEPGDLLNLHDADEFRGRDGAGETSCAARPSRHQWWRRPRPSLRRLRRRPLWYHRRRARARARRSSVTSPHSSFAASPWMAPESPWCRSTGRPPTCARKPRKRRNSGRIRCRCKQEVILSGLSLRIRPTWRPSSSSAFITSPRPRR